MRDYPYWFNARGHWPNGAKYVFRAFLRELKAAAWRLRDRFERYEYYSSGTDIGFLDEAESRHKERALHAFNTQRPWAMEYEFSIFHEGWEAGARAAAVTRVGNCRDCRSWNLTNLAHQRGICERNLSSDRGGYFNSAEVSAAILTPYDFGCTEFKRKKDPDDLQLRVRSSDVCH